MAENPIPKLVFQGRCPDCGSRQITLPTNLPPLGDDFDWTARDYDAIRLFMLEELAARFPERQRWTSADVEVVIVEALAAMLDQLSDMTDRVAAESYLDTARRPESVRRLLRLIGYDAVRLARLKDEPEYKPHRLTAEEQLERLWIEDPSLMERARRAGPRAVHDQHRMVTVNDYTRRLEEHPIIMRAAARGQWSGSWMTLRVAVILPWPNATLDDEITFGRETQEAIERFHEQRGIAVPDWDTQPKPTQRMIVRPYLDAYRMVGQEVMLDDAVPIGVALHLSVNVAGGYFQSEVRRAVDNALSTRPGGFFEPGRLSFFEDLHASDLFQVLMALEGVDNVCLNRFKRLGGQYPDQSTQGIISLKGLEIAVFDNDPEQPERGYFHLALHGGRKG